MAQISLKGFFVAWENSRHFTSAEILYQEPWCLYSSRVTTQIRVVPLIGHAAGGICFNQSEVLKCILRRKSTTHSFCYKIFRAQRGKLNFRITGTQGENKYGGPYVLLQFINVLYVAVICAKFEKGLDSKSFQGNFLNAAGDVSMNKFVS